MFQSFKSIFLKALISFILVPAAWLLANYFGLVKPMDNFFMDLRFKLRGNLSDDGIPPILYVNIDADAISMMGKEPIPMTFYAYAAKALASYGKAKVVAIDTVFSNTVYSQLVDGNKVSADHTAFKQVVRTVPNLVLAAGYAHGGMDPTGGEVMGFPFIYSGSTDAEANPLPEQPGPQLIGDATPNLGLINFDSNKSGGNCPRWVPMFAQTKNTTYYTMALEVFRVFYGLIPEAVQIYPDRIVAIGVNGKELLRAPLTAQQLLEVNWQNKWREVNARNAYSLREVVINQQNIEGNNTKNKQAAEKFFAKFKDAVVFIGRTDPSLQEMVNTPIDFSQVPEVCLHGNLLKTLFKGAYLSHVPLWADIALLLIFNALAVVVTLYNEHLKAPVKIFGILVLTYLAAAFLLFDFFNVVLPIALPVLSMLTTVIGGVTYQYIVERRQRSRITDIFGTYISPELVSNMVQSGTEPQLGGREREITAFFSDVQNFSSFSEILTPMQLVDLMNEYLTAMTDILQKEGGTLDKYIGDAIVAMFGAPIPMENHALRACITACKAQETQEVLRQKWTQEGAKWPKEVTRIRTRIGLNSGKAIVGNMGSSTRFNYTMMGDNVNLAARCESGAKTYGVYVMVTEDTHAAATQRSNEVVFRFLDRIVVKGRTKSVGVYEILGIREKLPLAHFDCIELYEKGLKKYWSQQWDGAIECFEKSSKLEPLQPTKHAGVSTNPSLLFIDRCNIMKQHPPAHDWDGVFVMKTK